VNAAATKGVSDREVSEFMRTLARIIDNLETAGEQPRRNRDRPVTPPHLLSDRQTTTEMRSSQ
jgi:hypothetical protein